MAKENTPCLKCRHATWKTKKNGSLHPDKSGQCTWTLADQPLPISFSERDALTIRHFMRGARWIYRDSVARHCPTFMACD